MVSRSGGIFVRRVLSPMKLPSALFTEERVEGCEGVYEWELTADMIRAMRHFQRVVNDKDIAKAEEVIGQLFDNGVCTEIHANNLARKLCEHDCESLKEVLLTAILTASRPLLEFVLQLFHKYPGAEFTGCQYSAAFPPHITPLMLACLCNNFAMVECLLLRGHQLDLPHRFDCFCKMCKNLSVVGRGEAFRMDSYRAACSEAFLWLATDDPLLAAMHMLKDLEVSQQFNNEHREIYQNLYRQVQNFATSLIQQCWSFEEVDFVLKQRNGSELSYVDAPYPRVRMALDYRMRQFVSHINVQTAMKNHWLGKWTDYGHSYLRDSYRILRHVFLFPILALLHSISGGKWIATFSYPRARFTSNAASYVLFIFIITSMRFSSNRIADRPFGKEYISLTEALIYVYIVGLLVSEVLEFFRRGIAHYFDMWWRWFVFIQLFVFVMAFVCFLGSFNNVNAVTMERRHWAPLNVALIYDIFFGSACLLTIGRVLYFAQLHRTLGSTIISTGRCLFQVVNYFVIMVVVMFAFAVAANTIHQPYTRLHALSYQETANEPRLLFGDLIVSMKHLFWAFYGYLNPTDYTLSVKNTMSNEFIAQTGVECLVAIYYVVMVITLLNLMISMLVKRAHEVQDNEEVEWKYTRLQIYGEYFEWSSAVPSPFNLIFLLTFMIRGLLNNSRGKNGVSIETDPEGIIHEHIKYKGLLVNLFKRYSYSKHYHYYTTTLVDKAQKSHDPIIKTMFMNKKPTS